LVLLDGIWTLDRWSRGFECRGHPAAMFGVAAHARALNGDHGAGEATSSAVRAIVN
jgi:hypothetical protein